MVIGLDWNKAELGGGSNLLRRGPCRVQDVPTRDYGVDVLMSVEVRIKQDFDRVAAACGIIKSGVENQVIFIPELK